MRQLDGYRRGVNLGGWLSQGSLEKEHLDTFILEEDLAHIASWGVDHIRLPLDFENVEHEDGSEKAEGYVYIDNCIAWCRKYGLNMVLDLHKTCGYTFDDAAYSCSFFENQTLTDRFLNLWDRLAARYAKDTDIVMFELLNEVVNPDSAQVWNELANRAVAVIRKYAPTARILIGGVWNNSVAAVPMLLPPVDEYIVYNCHCYDPLLFTHQSAYWVEGMPSDFKLPYPVSFEEYNEAARSINLSQFSPDPEDYPGVTGLGTAYFEAIFAPAIAHAEKHNVPLYCGEYGVIDRACPEAAVRWYRDIHAMFEKHGIGRAAWSYKEMDFGLIGEHYADVLDELIALL